MTRHRTGLAGAVATAAMLAGLLAFPVGAAATTNEPIAQTGGMTATLPLLGTSLTVDVSLDTVGNISGVTLTPSGDLTAQTEKPTVVKYANTAGTTTVSVKAKGSRLSISAKSATLADLVGDGTWAADVFGTGADSTVPYTIGDDGSGAPTLAIGTVAPASGITAEVKAPVMKAEDDEASASGGVTFSHDGYVKRLKISVEVDREDGHAHLRITLSGKDRQTLTASLAELAGPKTWSAHLCDGTPVAVNYHVDETAGTVMFDSATGAPATATAREHGLSVRFDGTRVGVKVSLQAIDGGAYKLVVKGRSGSCGDSGNHEKSGDWTKSGDHEKSGDWTKSGDHEKSGDSTSAGYRTSSGDGSHDGSRDGDGSHDGGGNH
jgi:hypothetical protein